MTDAGPLLTVADVTKRFGGVVALAGCTFDVARGTITGLIGPNGAGKTTLFKTIVPFLTGVRLAAAQQMLVGITLVALMILRPDGYCRNGENDGVVAARVARSWVIAAPGNA